MHARITSLNRNRLARPREKDIALVIDLAGYRADVCCGLQTEKSYQRQLGVQIGYKVNKKTKKIPGKAGLRFHKNVGLGFKTPKEAIEGKIFSFLSSPTLAEKSRFCLVS